MPRLQLKPSPFWYWLIGWVLIVVTGLWLEFRFFVVKNISCQINQGEPCPTQVTGLISKYQGMSYFSPRLTQLPARLASAFPGLVLEKYELDFPHSYSFFFKTLPPFISLQEPQAETWLYLSQDGAFIGSGPLPAPETSQVRYGSTYRSPTDSVDQPPMPFIISLVNQLARLGIPIQQLTILDKQLLTLTLPDDKLALFSVSQPVSRQVASLQVILTKATMSHETPVIDVRFDPPVLRVALPVHTSVDVKME